MPAPGSDRRGETAGRASAGPARGGRIALLAALLLPVWGAGAAAFEPLDGRFLASRSCPALQSIRKDTNPGGVRIEAGRAYPLIGANDRPASHFRVRVPGADPSERWIAADCGAPVAGPDEARPAAGPGALPAGEYVLAVSWHAAFCETARPLPECPGTRVEEALVLHGLWLAGRDAPSFCAPRDKRPRLTPALARRLAAVMPGTRSRLEDHQWAKHGSCFAATAEDYFAVSVALMEAVRASDVAPLLAGRIGAWLSDREVRAAFDGAFGPGAGERVQLVCERDGGRRLVRELRIHLSGPVAPDGSLGERIRGAPARPGGCRGGEVDAAGRS